MKWPGRATPPWTLSNNRQSTKENKMKKFITVFLAALLLALPAQAALTTTINTITYTGNAITTDFSFPYLFYDDTNLVVTIDGETQDLGVDYTVSGEADENGGTVTFMTAPASSTAVIIQRIVPYSQETDFENFDGNPADVTEKQFDLGVMQAQQNRDLINRAIKIPAGESSDTDLPAADDRAGKALIFDDDGDVTVSDGDFADLETQIGDISDNVASAASSASSASSSATSASSSATSASSSASSASTSASAASGSASSAASSAATFTTSGTSVSTVSVASGSKAFTTQAGIGWVAGATRVRVSTADGAKIMEGQVTAYSGTSVTINVDYTVGSGSASAWNLTATGTRGPAGAGSGDVVAANYGTDYSAAYSTFRSNVGLAIGANVQAYDAELAAFAGLTSASDKIGYFTGSGTMSTTDFTSTARSLLDDTSTTAMRSTLGLGTSAVLDVGTTASKVVQLDGSAKLPAVDGSQLTNLPSASGWSPVSTQTASSSSTLDFTGMSSSCRAYQFKFTNLRPSTDGASLIFRTSTDGGSTFSASSGNYIYQQDRIEDSTASPTRVLSGSGSTATSYLILDTIDNATSNTVSGTLTIYYPADITSFKYIESSAMAFENSSSNFISSQNFGARANTADVDSARFMFSGGAMTSGTIAEYCQNAS